MRVRETIPDRVLDEADEVVLVDLTAEELQERLRAGKVYPAGRVESALQNFFKADNLASLRQLALREVAEDVEARRSVVTFDDPLARRAISDRILVLVEPGPSGQRLLRRAWRSGQRLGADIDALWVHPPGDSLSDRDRTALAALRRLAVTLGVHFLEEEDGDSLPPSSAWPATEARPTCSGSPRTSAVWRWRCGRSLVPADRGATGHRHPAERRPPPDDRSRT